MEASTLQDIFVGREGEQRVYHDFLAHDSPWVLIITGLGGIGKSTLLDHLAKDTPSSVCTCKLDFNEYALRTEPLLILQRLSEQIRPFGDAQQVEALENTIQRDLDQLEQIRKIKLPSSSSNGASTNDANPQEAQLGALEDDAATKEIGRQMQELSTESFYDLIGTLHLDQLVLMLDTCEWLNEPEGWEIGQWVFNELLPEFRSRLSWNDQRCSVVLVSRVKPQLSRIDRQDQQYLPLSMLPKEAVYEYLARAGMHDPTLCQRVYDITHGHALSVSIIGAICQEQGEKSLTEEDFPLLQREFTEKASMQFVDERILSRLQSPYRELTRYGVLLRAFNLPLLQAVFFDIEALKGTDAPGIFDHLIRYPYIEPRGNTYYAFHELLREVIAEQVQQQDGPENERWKSYHQHALEHFTRVAPSSPDWYYHAIASNEEHGMREWLRAIQKASAPQKNALLQVTYDSTLKLSSAASSIRDYEQGRFNYGSIEWLDATGNVQQAADKRKEALTNFEGALQNFKLAHDSCGETLAQQAIDALQKPGKAQTAMLKSYWLACLSTSTQEPPVPVIPPLLPQFVAAPTAMAQPIFSQKRGLATLRGKTLLLIALIVLVPIIIAGGILSYGTGRFVNPRPLSAPIPNTPAQATATALANLAKSNPNPYPPFTGNLALYDPLRDNSAGYNWDKYSGKGEGCVFTEGAYHVLEPNSGFFFPCAANNTNFSNFTFEIQMMIIKGDCGGIIFRANNAENKYYFFEICQNGSYNLLSYTDASHSSVLASNNSQAIHTHFNQPNLIAVDTYSNHLYLYVNKQFIVAISDNTYSSGQIGVLADDSHYSTEVKFYNARVWSLDRDPNTTLQDTYTKATSGVPAITDQLQAQDVNNWGFDHPDKGFSCTFSGGMDVKTPAKYFETCQARANNFSNLALQVEMCIISGNSGGLVIRSDAYGTGYYFSINTDGTYLGSDVLVKSNESKVTTLFAGYSSAVKKGNTQCNQITVIAQGRELYMFVNQQFVGHISDGTYTLGRIGAYAGVLYANSETVSSDILFHNAKVWKL
jgi:hypothetical protein